VGYERIKSEHAGAKSGSGAWMTRTEAKASAKRKRRQAAKQNAADGRLRGLFAHIAPDASLADELIAEPKSASKTRRKSSGAAKADHIGASADMSKDPWTDPDPQPGDFDSELESSESSQIETHEGDPNAKLLILVRRGSLSSTALYGEVRIEPVRSNTSRIEGNGRIRLCIEKRATFRGTAKQRARLDSNQ